VNFLNDYLSAFPLQDTGESLGEEDERTVADLLVEQVEFCDVLLISKTDLLSDVQVNELIAILRTLNPVAEIVPMVRGQVPLEKLLNTGKFAIERARQAPGWLKELRGEHIPETEEYGIGSFVYRARRPFHPQKLHDFFSGAFDQSVRGTSGRLLRSKGFFWLASRPQWAGQWSQAGGVAQQGAAGMFWRAVPREQWPEDEEQLEYIMAKWQEPFGDMRQELVFIGQGLDQAMITGQLDACLLGDDELMLGQDYWKTLPDPFPQWFADE